MLVTVFLVPKIDQTVANDNEDGMGIISVIERCSYQSPLLQRSAIH